MKSVGDTIFVKVNGKAKFSTFDQIFEIPWTYRSGNESIQTSGHIASDAIQCDE